MPGQGSSAAAGRSWWQAEAGGTWGSPRRLPQCTPPPRHEGRRFVNEPELRLGRREGIIPESPTGCTKRGWAGICGSPCAGARAPACTRCLFSLALSHPMNNPGSCCGRSGGARVQREAAAQPGLGELTQAEAFCWCISHLENSSLRRHPLINPQWGTGNHKSSERFAFPPK